MNNHYTQRKTEQELGRMHASDGPYQKHVTMQTAVITVKERISVNTEEGEGKTGHT